MCRGDSRLGESAKVRPFVGGVLLTSTICLWLIVAMTTLPEITTEPQHARLTSGLWSLRDVFVLPRPRDEVFDFFKEARNLETLTPDFLKFKVLTPDPIAIEEGTLIDYRLRLHGFPMGWRSEIIDWDPPHAFVDQQLKGPYQKWHHLHRFYEIPGGTLCEDEVTYKVLGGALIRRLFVVNDLDRIFRYRRETLNRLFPSQ